MTFEVAFRMRLRFALILFLVCSAVFTSVPTLNTANTDRNVQFLSKELNLKQLAENSTVSSLFGGAILESHLDTQPLSYAPNSANNTSAPNDFVYYDANSSRLDHIRKNEALPGLVNNEPLIANLPLPTNEIARTAHWIWFADPTIYAQNKQYIDPLLNWPEESYTQISQWLGLTLPPGSFDGGRRAIYVDSNPGYFAWSCDGNQGIAYQVFKDIPDWPWVVIPHEMTNVFTGVSVTGGWPTDWWADGSSPFPAMVAVQVEKQYNIPYWSQHDAGDSNDPRYVMFRDKLQGTYGWALFQNAFVAMIRDGVNLAQWPSEYESTSWLSLHYLKSHIVAYYLSQAAGTDLSATLNQGSVGTEPQGWQGSYTPYQLNLSAVIPKPPTIQLPSGVQQGIIHLSVASSDDWGIKSVTVWYSTDGSTFTLIGSLTGGQNSWSATWNSTQHVQGTQNVWFKAVAEDISNFLSPQSVVGPLTVENNAPSTQILIAGVDSGQGNVSVPCTAGCSKTVGSSISVWANPSSGWQFSNWSTQSGISCASNNPCNFTMPNSQVTLKATFTQTIQTLITGVDSGNGSVNPNCLNLGCSDAIGSSVTVAATPAPGWQFSTWSNQTGIACSNNPCTFSMPNHAVSLRATFASIQYGFTISTPPSQSTSQGNSATFAFTVTTPSGTSHPATLSLTPQVPGTTLSWSPSNTTMPSAGGTAVQLTIQTTCGSHTQSYSNLQIRGAGGGASALSQTFSFTVTSSSSCQSFDFALSNSGGITVVQGSSGQNMITDALTNGSTQSVSLSCSGLPSGASCSVKTPTGNPTFSSTLTVSTSSSTPTGSSTITVTGTGGGEAHTTQFTLTVNSMVKTNTYVHVTVTSNPTGGGFVSVDGAPVTTAHSYSWLVGSTHTIAAYSLVQRADGQYVWTSWSDGGNETHIVSTPSQAITYTANFKQQFLLRMNSNPAAGGITTPTSGWLDAGSVVVIQATLNTGYAFSKWVGSGSGSYTGPNNATRIIIKGPITETVFFLPLLSVNPVTPPTPSNGTAVGSLPVTLLVQVTQGGQAVQGSIVTIYVDGRRAPGCLGVSDKNGQFSCKYTPTLFGHTYSWYATAAKSGFVTATSRTWSFSRNKA